MLGRWSYHCQEIIVDNHAARGIRLPRPVDPPKPEELDHEDGSKILEPVFLFRSSIGGDSPLPAYGPADNRRYCGYGYRQHGRSYSRRPGPAHQRRYRGSADYRDHAKWGLSFYVAQT